MSNAGAAPVDGGDYWVTPTDLEVAATHTRSTADHVQMELHHLQKFVMGMEAYWTGSAQGQFLELMADWNTYAQMLHDALVGISHGLEGNKVNYAEAERANMRNLHHVNLPPARF